jgi:NADPH-dependent curcumin reductase CurA
MSAARQSRRVVLARRPIGMPVEEDFRVETAPLRALADGEFLVENRLLAIDPAIRGFLDDRPSYLPPVAIGEAVRGMTLGRVAESREPRYPPGSFVRLLAAWEQLSIANKDALGLEIVETEASVPLATYMGALGPSGLTAYVGLHEIGHVAAGDTVLVSAAAGAVGSVAGQIAKLRGCRVVGIAGSAEKIRLLTGELGFDAAIDHRAVDDLGAAVHAACPQGVDVYFDNVGGQVLDAVLPQMAERGRVIVCGMIADYNRQDAPQPVHHLWQLVVKRLTMRGFLTYDHAPVLAEAQRQLRAWVQDGALKALENVSPGLASAPAALARMLSGGTIGKTLVQVEE